MNLRTLTCIAALLAFTCLSAGADQPPFSVDQVKKLHKLLLDGKGRFKATGSQLGYEFIALPNNSGYLMEYIAPGGGPTFRLNANFKLISATHTNSTSAPPAPLSESDAIEQYNETIMVWRDILDNSKG